MASESDVEEVLDFLLTPFSDIVSKANEAVENAGEDEPLMQKTAQTLSKEGQRALNRLEPLCKKIFNQHGSSFVRAIKTNGKYLHRN